MTYCYHNAARPKCLLLFLQTHMVLFDNRRQFGEDSCNKKPRSVETPQLRKQAEHLCLTVISDHANPGPSWVNTELGVEAPLADSKFPSLPRLTTRTFRGGAAVLMGSQAQKSWHPAQEDYLSIAAKD